MNPAGKSGFYRWRPSACLEVSGEDSSRFLQGQLTNDLQKIKESGAVYGLWLNQKGKVLADSFIQQKSDHEFRVISYFSPAAAIRARLEAYIIADDVVIEDRTEEVAGVTVRDEALARKLIPSTGWSFAGRRDVEPHFEVIFPTGDEASLFAKLSGVPELSAIEMERRRIASGIPAIPTDIGPGELPNEGGLEKDAISYTKGCYLGQEVMARLKSMGQVRRRLMRVRGTGSVPTAPLPLSQGSRKLGELRSAAVDGEGWVGLGLISLLALKPGEKITLGATPERDAELVDQP